MSSTLIEDQLELSSEVNTRPIKNKKTDLASILDISEAEQSKLMANIIYKSKKVDFYENPEEPKTPKKLPKIVYSRLIEQYKKNHRIMRWHRYIPPVDLTSVLEREQEVTKGVNCCGVDTDDSDEYVDEMHAGVAPEGDQVEALEKHLLMSFETKERAIKNWIKLQMSI